MIRTLSVILLKWSVNLLATLVLIRYVIPHGWNGYAEAAPVWVASFVIAFAFAEWIFRPKLPGKKETIRLVIMWVVLTYVLNVLGSVILFNTPRVAIYGTDLYVTLLFEIVAIILAAIVTRQRKIEKMLGEGMEG